LTSPGAESQPLSTSTEGDKAAAKSALAAAEPLLMKTAQKNVIHKKAASRKVSRLSARLKAMA
jgi:small subunit ribosomal protein S20